VTLPRRDGIRFLLDRSSIFPFAFIILSRSLFSRAIDPAQGVIISVLVAVGGLLLLKASDENSDVRR
jgi:hypothetical protein